MNNCINILNGSSVYNLRVEKWLCSEACESECDYPLRNIRDSDNVEHYHPWQA
jgi:hypothetical protein